MHSTLPLYYLAIEKKAGEKKKKKKRSEIITTCTCMCPYPYPYPAAEKKKKKKTNQPDSTGRAQNAIYRVCALDR